MAPDLRAGKKGGPGPHGAEEDGGDREANGGRGPLGAEGLVNAEELRRAMWGEVVDGLKSDEEQFKSDPGVDGELVQQL